MEKNSETIYGAEVKRTEIEIEFENNQHGKKCTMRTKHSGQTQPLTICYGIFESSTLFLLRLAPVCFGMRLYLPYVFITLCSFHAHTHTRVRLRVCERACDERMRAKECLCTRRMRHALNEWIEFTDLHRQQESERSAWVSEKVAAEKNWQPMSSIFCLCLDRIYITLTRARHKLDHTNQLTRWLTVVIAVATVFPHSLSWSPFLSLCWPGYTLNSSSMK